MAGQGSSSQPFDAFSPVTTSRAVTNALYESGLSPSSNWRTANPMWDPAQLVGSPGAAAGNRMTAPPTSAVATAEIGAGLLQQKQPQAAGSGPSERPEESEFGAVVGELMHDQLSAADSVRAFADVATQRAASLREAAAAQLQSDVRYHHLQDQASELELEASTWALVDALYGNRDPAYPGGLGGPVLPGCGRAGASRTYAQRAADLVAEDELLNRVARVVAWLESSAARQLDREESSRVGGLGNRFSKDEGVWRETHSRVASAATARIAGAGAYVSELDPDAATRQSKSLDPDNARDEERLLAYAWRLLRAGKLDAVRQLCVDCGQPWRAASLGGAGGMGPVPVGAAAAVQDSMEGGAADVDADLAMEVDGGCGTRRALWLWSAYQVSEQAAAALEATGRGSGGGLFEAALYGALCGNLGRLLPVCGAWEDACWAYFRCWLDLSIALQLPPEKDADLVSVDALAGSMGDDASILRQAMGVVAAADWPVARLRDAIPATFEDIFRHLAGSGVEAVSGPAGSGHRQRLLQADLVMQHLERLLCGRLLPWVTQGAEPGGGVRTGGGREGGTDFGPPCSPALMRFAAHLGIALQALEVIPPPDDPRAGQYGPVHDAVNRLLQAYVVHLMDSGAYAMIPQYACFLRSGLRRLTYSILLDELTSLAGMEACRRAHALAAQWFGFWRGGDMDPMEMAIITDRVATTSREVTQGGPKFRAQAARWLCFDEATHMAAGRHLALLCRECALGGLPGAVAGWDLMYCVAPDALQGELPGALSLGEGPAARAVASELSTWLEFFSLQRDLAEWADYYERLAGEQASSLTSSTAGPTAATTTTTPGGDYHHHYHPGQQPWVASGPLEALGVAAEDAEQMIDSSAPLLQQLLAFVRSAVLDPSLEGGAGAPPMGPEGGEEDGAGEGGAGQRCSVVMVVAPMPGADQPADVQDGLAYARLPPHQAAQLASSLQASLRVALSRCPDRRAAAALTAEAIPCTGEFEGMVELRLGAGPGVPGATSSSPHHAALGQAQGSFPSPPSSSPALPQLLAGLAAAAIKGALPPPTSDFQGPSGGTGQSPGPPSTGPLQVVNLDAPPALHAEVLRRVLYPQLCLRAGAIREALVRLGADPSEGMGADLVTMVAGADGGSGPPGLAAMFSAAELQELLELERLTELHVLERQQREAEQQQQQDSA